MEFPEDFNLNATRSPKDHKSYHLFTLPDNSLQTLLIFASANAHSKNATHGANRSAESVKMFSRYNSINESHHKDHRHSHGGHHHHHHPELLPEPGSQQNIRNSVDFDFLQQYDMGELQRSGILKQSKHASKSNFFGNDKSRTRSPSAIAHAESDGSRRGLRRRLTESLLSSRSNTSSTDGEEDIDTIAAAAATAIAAASDPVKARRTFEWSSSRQLSIAPEADMNREFGISGTDESGVPMAAVSMSVGVGSLSDPKEFMGMSHFLEHMLSMGSDLYPEEECFGEFISNSGGSYNAFTESEEMVFFFEVRQEALVKALDMFARFFIAPLLLEDSAKREIQAVQSELNLLLGRDDFRMAQVWRHTSRPNTPYQSFNVGSTETLAPLLNDLTPMKEFFKKYFIGQNMKLTVFAPTLDPYLSSKRGESSTMHEKLREALGKLQNIIFKRFSKIPGDHLAKPRDPTTAEEQIVSCGKYGLPWLKLKDALDKTEESESTAPDHQGASIGCVYRIVALHSGTHRIRLSFPLGPKTKMEDEDVHNYISYVIGHESKGGILAELKAKGWGHNLVSGVGDGGQLSTSGYRVFIIQIMLTSTGLREWVQVVGLVFQFIGQVLVKSGPKKRYFEEYTAVQRTAHEYYEEPKPLELVKWCSRMLLPRYCVPNAQLLRARLNTKWQPKAIKQFCESLTVENVRIDISSRRFEKFAKRSAKKYGKSSRKSKKPRQGADHLPNKELGNKVPILEPISKSFYWVDRVSDSINETWNLMYNGTVKLYLRHQVGHDEKHTPGLALPPHNPYISKSLSLVPFTGFPLSQQTTQLVVNAMSKFQSDITENDNSLELSLDGKSVVGFDQSQSMVLITSMENNCPQFRWTKTPTEVGNQLHAFYRQSITPDSPKTIPKLFMASSLYPLALREQNHSPNLVDLLRDTKFSIPCIVSNEEDESLAKVWMLQDIKPKNPYVAVYVRIIAPKSMMSVRSSAYTDLFVNLVKDHLHNELFLATEAGLTVQFENTSSGLELKIEGLSNCVPNLVQKCLDKMFRYSSDVLAWYPPTEMEFETQVEATVLSYSPGSEQVRDPADAADIAGGLKSLLIKNIFQPHKKSQLLKKKKINFAHFQKFIDSIFSTCFVEALVVGNVNYDIGNQVAARIVEILRKKNVSAVDSIPRVSPVIVPRCSTGTISGLMQIGVSQAMNQSVSMHFQAGIENRKDRVLLQLLEQMMQNPLFHNIRTQEQVGYAVVCHYTYYHGMLGFNIDLVSDTHTPQQCIEKVETFLAAYRSQLEATPAVDFAANVSSLAIKLKDEGVGLKVRGYRTWKKIKVGDHDWRQIENDCVELEKLTLTDLLSMFDRVISPKVSTRRRATMIVTAANYTELPELLLSMVLNPKVSLMNGTEPYFCSTFKRMTLKGKKKAKTEQKDWMAKRAAIQQKEQLNY